MARHIHIHIHSSKTTDSALRSDDVQQLVDALHSIITAGKPTKDDAGAAMGAALGTAGKKKFEEHKHPRDAQGKFTSGGLNAAQHQQAAAYHKEQAGKPENEATKLNHSTIATLHGALAKMLTDSDDIADNNGENHPAAHQNFNEASIHASALANAKKMFNINGPFDKPEGESGGLGEKPMSDPGKGSIKANMHALLSSGHPFTVQELMQVTGVKSESLMKAYLTDLKNPKYAGKAGPLEVVKLKDGTYQVQKKSTGEPLPAPPAASAPKPAPAPAPKPAPEPAPAPAPKPAPEPAPAPAPEPDPFAGAPEEPQTAQVAKPSGGKKSTLELDSAYKHALDKAALKVFVKAKAAAPNGAFSKELATKLAKEWKKDKALAMAQYAADASGKEVPVAGYQEVFPEDLLLMSDYAFAEDDADFNAAYQKWKKSTAEAKKKAAGIIDTPASAPTSGNKTPAAKKEAHIPMVPSQFTAPKKYVPDGHKYVDKESMTATGPGSFEHGIESDQNTLQKDSKGTVPNKVSLCGELAERMKKSPHFTYLTEMTGKTHDSLVRDLIGFWASTSGDHQAASVAMQRAVADAFGMSTEHLETEHMDSNFHNPDKLAKEAGVHLGMKIDTKEKAAAFHTALQDFVKAQYQHTQEHFAKNGIKELHLLRGQKDASHNAVVNVKMQPASSFSTEPNTALKFASGHNLLYAKIPASQVLGSYLTGFGCTHEDEVVVLAHPGMQAVSAQAPKSYSMESIAAHIKQKVKTWA